VGKNIWFIISEYADTGDYEIIAQGTMEETESFFQTQLRTESKIKGSDVRNITDYQFEVWIEQHYQYDMKPGLAYTVKLTDNLPNYSKH